MKKSNQCQIENKKGINWLMRVWRNIVKGSALKLRNWILRCRMTLQRKCKPSKLKKIMPNERERKNDWEGFVRRNVFTNCSSCGFIVFTSVVWSLAHAVFLYYLTIHISIDVLSWSFVESASLYFVFSLDSWSTSPIAQWSARKSVELAL